MALSVEDVLASLAPAMLNPTALVRDQDKTLQALSTAEIAARIGLANACADPAAAGRVVIMCPDPVVL